MQTKVNKEFEQVNIKDHPFVKELFKRARTAAKKYDSTQRAVDKIKAGGKVDSDQKKKIENQESYLRSVEEALETLALFQKFQPVEADVPEGAD